MTITITLNTDDIIDWRYTREHWRTTEMLECRGFTDGSSPQPIFSRWPGNAPGQGNQSLTVERLIADNQSDLNNRCGRRGAAADGIYVDANGVMQMALDLELTLPTGYHVADFYDEYVAIELTTSLRGLDLSDQLFVLRSVRLEPADDGTLQCVWTLRTATNGVAGVTYVPPTEETNGLPDYNFPPIVFDPWPYTPTPVGNFLNAGTQSLWATNSDGYGYYCGPTLTGAGFDVTALQGGPVWNRVALSVTGTILDSVQSAFTLTRDILVTSDDDAIWTVDNVGPSPTVTLRKTLRAALTDTTRQWRMIDASFGADYIVVVTFYGNDGANGGVWYTYSTDGGTTWSAETQVTAGYNSDQGTHVPGLFVSSRNPGQAEFGAFTASGSGTAAEAVIYRVTGTFGSPASTGIGTGDILPGSVHRSWADNENTAYYAAASLTGSLATRNQVYRKIGSGSPVLITPVIGGNNCRPFYTRGLHTCPIDANTVLAAVAGNTSNAVVMSRDKGTTWTALTAGAATPYDGAECAGNNRNYGYVWGDSGAIGAVDLAAGLIDDRRGNIPTDFPSAGRFVRIRGL